MHQSPHVVVAVFLGLVLAGCGKPSSTGLVAAVAPPTPVVVAAAASATLAEQVTAIGTVQAWDEVALSPRDSGPVTAVHLVAGMRVAAGAILVELDHASQDAALAEAAAAVAQADLDVRRLAPLVERGVAEAGVLDQARTALAAAVARQALSQARRNDRILRAPFDGRVGLTAVATGAWLGAGQAVTTIQAEGPMRVVFAVPEAQAAAIAVGQAVRVVVTGRIIAGAVSAVDTRIDQGTRQLGVFARIPAGSLPAGTAVRVEVVLSERLSVVVPEEALELRGTTAQVWTVAETATGAVARPVKVVPGQRQQGRIEISSGLSAGTPVVIRGLQSLRPNTAVSATTVLPAGGR